MAGHDPADYIPPAPVARIPDASPARTPDAYHDMWFFLAARDPRITRAYMEDDSVDTTTGACALHTAGGTAWVHHDGSITATGRPSVATELRSLIHQWAAAGRPALTRFTATLAPTRTGEPLWTPSRWTVGTGESSTSKP